MTVDDPAQAERLRELARECRRLSQLMTDRRFITQYLALADSYEMRAFTAELRSSGAPRAAPPTPPRNQIAPDGKRRSGPPRDV